MYSYETKGVCSTQIDVELNGNIIENVKFHRGCDGNLKAISKVVQGKSVEEVITLFEGITCNMRNTSCSDQLTKALQAAYDEQKK